jgi:hypothetical protein
VLYQVHSYPNFRERIPNGFNVTNPCDPDGNWLGVGHEAIGGGGKRNPFGLDFAGQGYVSIFLSLFYSFLFLVQRIVLFQGSGYNEYMPRDISIFTARNHVIACYPKLYYHYYYFFIIILLFFIIIIIIIIMLKFRDRKYANYKV